MISIKFKVPTFQVSVEVLHSPDGGLHFQQERRVVLLVFLKLPTGISDDAVFSVWVDLGQDGSQSSFVLLVSNCSVRDECLGAIPPGIIDDLFRDQHALQGSERFLGLDGYGSFPPQGFLLGEMGERCCDD